MYIYQPERLWSRKIKRIWMETMKKITSVEQAIALFEKYTIKREGAIHCGNSKKANYYYDKNQNIVQYLREMKCLDALSVFYEHPNISVRSWAACFLLPLHEKKSLSVLKEIANMNIFGSLDAEMTIKEWKNGNLKNFYTL